MKRKQIFNKYLTQHAEPFAYPVFDWPASGFTHGVVVPCYDEPEHFAERLRCSKLWQKSVLVIVVINQSRNQPTFANNERLWRYFTEQNNRQIQGQFLLTNPEGHGWFLVVDCFSEAYAFTQHAGVGRARKFGCDLAVQLIQQGVLQTSWLHSTDADTDLPDNYFELPSTNASAIVLQHEHMRGDAPARVYAATKLYETAIDYYTQGLKWAGSPYGFATIGSCLVIDALAYCQARGFPRKQAGEDFYLLNKLAKLQGVTTFQNIVVRIHARTSNRNPFGTGPAVGDIIANDWSLENFPYYDPQVFEQLKHLMQITTVIDSFDALPQQLLAYPECYAALNALKLDTFLAHIQKQRCTLPQAHKAWDDWFDAFKTLKFVHHLQTHYYPARPLADCLAKSCFAGLAPTHQEPTSAC